MHDLFGTGTGGLNDPLLHPPTVTKDTAIDQLFGQGGVDWFHGAGIGSALDKACGVPLVAY